MQGFIFQTFLESIKKYVFSMYVLKIREHYKISICLFGPWTLNLEEVCSSNLDLVVVFDI